MKTAKRADPFGRVAPCDNCPFRTDRPFYLHPARVAEIDKGLIRGTFSCHKTTRAGGGRGGKSEQHCAGALIVLEKMDRPSQMMRIAERLGLYDRRKLKMDAPVYDSMEEMLEDKKRLEFRSAPADKDSSKSGSRKRRAG